MSRSSPHRHRSLALVLIFGLCWYFIRSSAHEDRQRTNEDFSAEPTEDVQLDPVQMQVYEQLRHWRSTQASEEGVPPYVVAHNKALKQMACLAIQTKEDLQRIKQFGAKRVEKYGDSILDVLAVEQTP